MGFPLFFLLLNGPQYIAGLGNVRQVDLRLLVALLRFAGDAGNGLAAAAQSSTHTYRFVLLHRAGVGLLFRNADFREKIENDLALDF